MQEEAPESSLADRAGVLLHVHAIGAYDHVPEDADARCARCWYECYASLEPCNGVERVFLALSVAHNSLTVHFLLPLDVGYRH